MARLKARTRPEETDLFNASKLAVKLLGDSLGANLMLTGFAWQRGMIPISSEALLQAIELNGVAVDWNKEAFCWGRRLAHEPELIKRFLVGDDMVQPLVFKPSSAQDWKEKYSAELVAYQNEAYAARYRALVDRVVETEKRLPTANGELATAVAKAGYKLMAYKDEYEVARLYASPEFLRKLEAQFEGDYALEFNLAPPIIAPKDKASGKPTKIQFGPWMLRAFGLLAKFKFLRGTKLDPFGYLEERRMERRLIEQYFQTVDRLLRDLDAENHSLALQIAELPMTIRGYGHVKDENAQEAHARQQQLMGQWPPTRRDLAA